MFALTDWPRSRRRPALLSLVATLMLVVGLSAAPTRADDPGILAGRWTAKGHDPGADPAVDPGYAGNVLLTVKGDSLLYEGEMSGETYRGVGIWDPATATLALDFVEEGSGRRGLAHFVLENEHLEGRWVFSDEPANQGTELWTRADE